MKYILMKEFGQSYEDINNMPFEDGLFFTELFFRVKEDEQQKFKKREQEIKNKLRQQRI